MSALNRRNALAALAAVPAVSLPAITAAAEPPDPVFDLIKQYHAAIVGRDAADAEQSKIEGGAEIYDAISKTPQLGAPPIRRCGTASAKRIGSQS